MTMTTADASQAKETGGMVALLPTERDARILVRDGGEPLDDLHLTLAYLGENVIEHDPRLLREDLELLSVGLQQMSGQILGSAAFNVEDPCEVYLISDCKEICDLYEEVWRSVHAYAVELEAGQYQHHPFIAHITARYESQNGEPIYFDEMLDRVTFDRLLLTWGPDRYIFPLTPPGDL